MTLTRIVAVDYDELADHLQVNYSNELADSPLPTMTFNHFREVLDQHVEDLMDADSFATDEDLTHILLKRHTFGSVTEIFVSRSPGHVVYVGKRGIVLPLILLQIEY